MKIYGNNRMNGVNPYQKTSQPSMDKAKKASSFDDKVQISSEALEMLNKNKTSEASRSDRIQQLKEQIQNGTYKVDSQKIAEKLYEKEFKGI